MVSIDICNEALSKIGASQVNVITENTPQAVACTKLYYPTLYTCLETHWWNFATKLSTGVVVPTSLGLFLQMPDDTVKIRTVNNSDDFSTLVLDINGQDIRVINPRSESDSYSINYTYKVDDETKYSPMFREYFSLYLGAELSRTMGRDSTLTQTLLGYARGVLRNAIESDIDQSGVLTYTSNYTNYSSSDIQDISDKYVDLNDWI